MPLPQAVEGILADVHRSLINLDGQEVTKLRFFDASGDLLVELTEFWNVEAPKIRFGDNYETTRFVVVEQDDDLTEFMETVRTLRYVVLDENTTEAESQPYFTKKIPNPPLGRNRKWNIDTTTEAFISEFFTAPGA